MFYVEGVVDSLEFEVKDSNLKRFSLAPSSEFMIALPDGTKKALFVDSFGKNACERNVASLTKVEAKDSEKNIVFFEPQSLFTHVLIDTLVQAKCNRLKVRVCIGRSKDKRNNAIPHPDLTDVVEIHLI